MDKEAVLIDRSKVNEILMSSMSIDNEATVELLTEIDQLPSVTLAEAEEAVGKLEELVARLKLEAQMHAQEARTANATIAETYQAVTGATGEPGNWNGANPIIEKIERLTQERDEWKAKWESMAAASLIAGTLRMSHPSDHQ